MNQPSKKINPYHWSIITVFLLLSVSFFFNLWGETRQVRVNEVVASRFISNDTVRDPLKAIPVVQQAGFKFNCNNCHEHITPSDGRKDRVAAHPTVKMEHGINRRCYNCHDRFNREQLVDIDGASISFSSSELLCQKCHGPKYRDWLVGVHGRPNGYWDKNKGESKKATCVACHNPHTPKFQAMEPAPAPIRSDYLTDEEFSHE